MSTSLAKIDQCNRLSNEQIIEILKMVEAYVDPQKNKNVFENVDDELARRISSFTIEQMGEVFRVIFEHNSECPAGYEI